MTESPVEQLASLKFRSTADPKLRKAAAHGDLRSFQKLFQKQTAPARKQFDKLFRHVPFNSVWSVDLCTLEADIDLSDALLAFHTTVNKSKTATAGGELSTVITPLISRLETAPLSPFSTTVAAETLLRYVKALTPDQATLLFTNLARVVPEDFEPSDADDRISANVECPYILSQLLNSVHGWKTVGTRAAKAASEEIENVTDTDGTLAADTARRLHSWLPPLTRMSGWAFACDGPWLAERIQRRWNRVLEYAARLIGPSGQIMSVEAEREQSFDAVLDSTVLQCATAAAGFAPSSKTRKLLHDVTSHDSESKRRKSSKSQTDFVQLSTQSDWSETALFRNSLRSDSDVAYLSWDNEQPRFTLAPLDQPLFAGNWNYSIKVDGNECTPSGDWICTCWFDDNEVAFAELEAGSESGMRHVRHIMLSLQDHFAIITDSVTCSRPDSRMEFSSQLPVVDQVICQTDPVTRDLLLHQRSHAVRVVPAWLDDDRVQHALGDLTFENNVIKMTAHNAGGITLPLVVDWHPDRRDSDADWNVLTVTEDRRVVTAHEAAGFRVRIGELQLMLYRSLRPGNEFRAVLGHHTNNETVYGQVQKDGDIRALVMVDSEAS